MDKRSWLWKKKSSDKAATVASDAAAVSRGDQDKKRPKYVQISMECYSHLTGLEVQLKVYENQVRSLEDEVNELNEKLSAANVEMTNQENLVKQHAKVAEEAVSGWEKAEAEAAELKNNLESVTLLKLTAEDRASHLDDALKECMRQIRNLKEEHEQNLHEAVVTQTKQLDKMKFEFEAKITNLDQELMRSAAENAAISRSLQERSNMLIKISQEKSQAEAEIELLKSNINSCEREISSLKYETHVLTKELEIRNEEKNMSVRSAEVANKQHLEGVKKIVKLESECQRLRGLVRKKLPGPAALAQMKLEVENMGRDYGETRVRRSPGKPPSPHSLQLAEMPLDHMQKFHKENDLLSERLLAMEEEGKMLKEALAMQNSELQASRDFCAKIISKLHSLEGQEANNQHTSPSKSNIIVPTEGLLSHSPISPPSFTSVSEDGNEDRESCSGSWAPALTSKKLKRTESSNNLDLMDDFLEMEKLAYSANGMNGPVSGSDLSNSNRPETANEDIPQEVTNNPDQNELNILPKKVPTTVELSVEDPQSGADSSPLKKLQSIISMLPDSIPKDAEMDKILGDIKVAVQKASGNKAVTEGAEVTPEKVITLPQDSNSDEEMSHMISDDLASAISQVHGFVLLLEKEAISVQGLSSDEDGLSHNVQRFHLTFDQVIRGKTSLLEFILALSHVLNKASALHFTLLGFKNNELETNGSDCIDKIALPENKVVQGPEDRYPNGCGHFSDSISDLDIPHEGICIPTIESNGKCDEYEQLKQEKEGLVLELARSDENLQSTKAQLQESQQLLVEVKSQLASAQKLNGLAETQLKCMAESYKSLETRAEELETEVNFLHARIENLENELKEEKKNHQDAVANCRDLEEKLQSITAADKTNQEKELAAASEKLAECQETIYLLGRQLNSLRPHADLMGSPSNGKTKKGEQFPNEEPAISRMNSREHDQNENFQGVGGEYPVDMYNAPFSPSDNEPNTPVRSPIGSKHPKHRPTKSGSSSSSSNPTPEKNPRGFSRFFSSKSKNGY